MRSSSPVAWRLVLALSDTTAGDSEICVSRSGGKRWKVRHLSLNQIMECHILIVVGLEILEPKVTKLQIMTEIVISPSFDGIIIMWIAMLPLMRTDNSLFPNVAQQ